MNARAYSRVYHGAGSVLADDDYVRDRVRAFAARTGDDRHAARKRLDGQIARLDKDAKERDGRPDPREQEPWEAAKARIDKTSVRDLRALLPQLRAQDIVWHAATLLVHGYGNELREPGPLLLRDAARGVEWLADRLPDRLVVPPQPSELERQAHEALT